jgi:hypothetical protein
MEVEEILTKYKGDACTMIILPALGDALLGL